ncbi:MAG: hypothetical protein PHZ00_03150 [Candidatus Peribacteraceae bacterium]|nr:hypothetical protein [Candidatus Peribacteraceae bacterium]
MANQGKTQKIDVPRENIPAVERNPSASEKGVLDELRTVVEAAKKSPAESLGALAKLLQAKAEGIVAFEKRNPELVQPGKPHDSYLAKRVAVTDRLELVQSMA